MMLKIYLISIAFLVAIAIYGQSSIRPNLYFKDMQYHNPAVVAIDSTQHSHSAIYGKYKLVDNRDKDIWNKPMNIWLSHAQRIGNSNSFYTISYVNDDYSFYNRNALYMGFVQQTRLSQSSVLSYGGRLVTNWDIVNWDKFTLPHNESGRGLKFTPDLDIGASYQNKRLTAGVGVKNLISTSSKMEGSTLLKNWREFNVNLSYRQPLGQHFDISPFAMLTYERKAYFDAGISVSVFNKANVAYILRVNELKSIFTLDVNVYKGFSIGMAYDRSSLVSDNNIDFVLRWRR